MLSRLALATGSFHDSAGLGESDRLERLNRLMGEARVVGDGATVIFVNSTATPGSAPDLLGVQRVPKRRSAAS